MDPTRTDSIPNPAVRRLSLYLRQLESFKRKDRRTVSSKQLGESLNLTDAQVRKDLAYFGQFGHPGVGYRVEDLINQVRRILGTDKTWDVLLVGAGNLGRALMAYNGFDVKGFRLVAVFDSDPAKIGTRQGPFPGRPDSNGSGDKRFFIIQPMSDLKSTVEKQAIRLAILAVPADSAQEVADQCIEAGIRGLLNFAPVSLRFPSRIAMNAVDLAVQLEQLSFQVNFSPLGQTV
ncbi:MAG: redox-sensing transcriptional repressor Rex [Tepidisphaeraceae bacterium]|jgi:redox-sensing transcriptional repressor